MPIYLYQNPTTKEVKEVIQTMKEEHVYVDSSGLKWDRIFSLPNTQIDADIDPFSSRDFTSKTAKKRMSLGDMWDASKELSDQRTKRLGHDPVKEKTAADYKKKTTKDHPLL